MNRPMLPWQREAWNLMNGLDPNNNAGICRLTLVIDTPVDVTAGQ